MAEPQRTDSTFCYVCNIPLYKGYESFTGLCIKHIFEVENKLDDR